MKTLFTVTLLSLLACLLHGCSHSQRAPATPSTHSAPTPATQPAPEWAGALNGPSLAGFQLTEQFERRGTFSITATNNTGSVLKLERITGLDPDSAKRLTDDGLMNLEALYANALSPYPGDLSNQVVTEKGFHPKRISGTTAPGFILFANDRFGFGASTREQVKFKALLGWIHCPQAEELTKVRLYVPPETPDEALRQFLNGITCRPTP